MRFKKLRKEKVLLFNMQRYQSTENIIEFITLYRTWK